jgi:tRNA threonylcarbamoyladenosine biosynthesis protein TsaB
VRVLAFDCCLAACSAALLDERGILASRHEAMGRGQAERLTPMVEEVRAEAGLAWSEIDLICVTVGPGSFTGVRVGLAAAQGFALAADIPILGLSTLEAATARIAGRATLAVIDARRDQVYAQAFSPERAPLAPPQLLSPQAAAALAPPHPFVVVGPGALLLMPCFTEGSVMLPGDLEAEAFGRLAFGRAPQAVRGAPPRPLYLRAPDAKPAS